MNDGIFLSLQFLVLDVDQPTLAKDLVKYTGITSDELIQCNEKSKHYEEEMAEFIDSCF